MGAFQTLGCFVCMKEAPNSIQPPPPRRGCGAGALEKYVDANIDSHPRFDHHRHASSTPITIPPEPRTDLPSRRCFRCHPFSGTGIGAIVRGKWIQENCPPNTTKPTRKVEAQKPRRTLWVGTPTPETPYLTSKPSFTAYFAPPAKKNTHVLDDGRSPRGQVGQHAVVVHHVEERDAPEVDTEVCADTHRAVLAPEHLRSVAVV